ncbi:MAG TPA: glycosyltransferase family 1 protein [Longimicrobiaceae bacterium]|nr:glycosyltransferase family 1 protein [Longimicrobiaceae bacterium]
MKLGINGRFYAARATGVQRFAVGVATRLLPEATLFLPSNAEPPADLPSGTRVVRGRLAGHAWEQIALPVEARRSGCDVILHMGGTAPLTSVGDVFVIHDLLPLTHPHWFRRSFRLWRNTVFRVAAPRAGRVVTVTDWVRGQIATELGVSLSRIVVAPQGLEPFDAPATPAAVAAVRERHGLPETFLLAVGADPRKNLPFLGQVLSRWRERGEEPPPLVVAGRPYPHLFTPSAGWPEGVDVRLLGHVDDGELHALYTAAAVLCFPSRAEGFGRPPLEAMACGTPAVVADYGPTAEVVKGAARVVPLAADAWVDALQTLLASGERADPSSAVTALYRWEFAAERVREACAAAAAERGRR